MIQTHNRSVIASAPGTRVPPPRPAPAPGKVPLLVITAMLLPGMAIMIVFAMLMLLLLLRHMHRLWYSPVPPRPSCLPPGPSMLRGLIQLPPRVLGCSGVTSRVGASTLI